MADAVSRYSPQEDGYVCSQCGHIQYPLCASWPIQSPCPKCGALLITEYPKEVLHG